MTLKQAQEKFALVYGEAKALAEKENRTPEESKTLQAKVDEANALKREIETLKTVEGLSAFDTAPVNTKGMFANSEKAGTTQIKADGTIENEGDSITQKQVNAISEPTYKKAFMKFITGKDDVADYKALSEGLDTNGGYLVPPEFVDQIIKRDAQQSGFINQINVLNTVKDSVRMPRLNYTTDDIYESGVRISWTGENGPVPEATDPQWGEIEIPVFAGGFQLEFSRDLAEDYAAIENVLTEQGQVAYRLGAEDVLITATSGTGIGRPEGILLGAGGAGYIPAVNVGSPVSADGLIGGIYGLPPQYADNARVMMNSVAMATFATIKDTDGAYIFGLTDRNAGLAAGRIRTLLGYPIDVSAFMPSPGSGNSVMVFGDFRKTYTMVQRVGLSVEPYGLQDKAMLNLNRLGLHFRFRMGGKVVQPRAARVFVQS